MQLAKKVYIGLQPLGKRSSFEKKKIGVIPLQLNKEWFNQMLKSNTELPTSKVNSKRGISDKINERKTLYF